MCTDNTYKFVVFDKIKYSLFIHVYNGMCFYIDSCKVSASTFFVNISCMIWYSFVPTAFRNMSLVLLTMKNKEFVSKYIINGS